MTIRYPMEHGIVKDWNDMERIWQYIYSKDQLHTFSEEVKYLSSLQRSWDTFNFYQSKQIFDTFE